MSNFKVVSLFSGCGGSDLGMQGGFYFIGKKYSRLPIDIVFANDIDKKAAATFDANFDIKTTVGPIQEVKHLIPQHDILIGGFPCQSFSTVNPTKDPFDERGQLYKEMSHILETRRPIAFIAENVKGMMTLHKGKIFNRILEEFSSKGYELSYRLINAADYGVPQRRERVFIVGIRDDVAKRFSFPAPLHSAMGISGLMPWVPLRNVIDSLVPSDPKYYFSEKAVLGMKNAKNNMKRGLAQDLSQPSLTVTSHLAKVSINSRDPVLLVDPDKELYRRFTPLEAARIQSFPDTFKFIGSEADAYRQIGNAIAPVVMWHITNTLVSLLDEGEIDTVEPIPMNESLSII